MMHICRKCGTLHDKSCPRCTRHNQPITRGELLDAIDEARSEVGCNHDVAADIFALLDRLRRALE